MYKVASLPLKDPFKDNYAEVKACGRLMHEDGGFSRMLSCYYDMMALRGDCVESLKGIWGDPNRWYRGWFDVGPETLSDSVKTVQ